MIDAIANHFKEYYPDMPIEDIKTHLANDEVLNNAMTHIAGNGRTDPALQTTATNFVQGKPTPLLKKPLYPENLLQATPELSTSPKPPVFLKLNDTRKVDAASGNTLTDKNRFNGDADSQYVKDIITSAKKNGVDPYTALAMVHQETGLKGDWQDNPLHVDFKANNIPEDANILDASMQLLKQKLEYGKKLGKKQEAELLQAWNGYGKIGAGGEYRANKYYGIDVSKQPIDMNKNPVYGKRVLDIRENILKKNPEIRRLIQSTK